MINDCSICNIGHGNEGGIILWCNRLGQVTARVHSTIVPGNLLSQTTGCRLGRTLSDISPMRITALQGEGDGPLAGSLVLQVQYSRCQ